MQVPTRACTVSSEGVGWFRVYPWIRWRQVAFTCLLSTIAVHAQQIAFRVQVYPVLEKAGCRACHNPEGVASPTRLHFPEKNAPTARIDAFGDSLVELVDRESPEKSLLLLKPTARLSHAGGERIPKASPEEATLRAWIARLAKLSGKDLAVALQYKQKEAVGYGQAPTVGLRRMTHSQYNATVRALLRDSTKPSKNFPPEDFVNGFRNQYESLSISPILAEAYARSAERLASNAFRRGDSRGLIPCEPNGAEDAACRKKFIEQFGRKAFRRPLEASEITGYDKLFRGQGNFLRGAQTVMEAMLQSPSFLFWIEETPKSKLRPYAVASQLAYFIWNGPPDDALLANADSGELNSRDGVE